jgi:serine/threonine protein kinase
VLSPGDVVGQRYRVLAQISSGSTGRVYRAVDDALDTSVALKVFPHAGPADRREVAAIARLNHPNVVRVYDIVDLEGGLCIVQEWVAGPSLDTLLGEHGQLDLATTTDVAIDVARALGHAHGQGIVHRDIKPSNVLRAADGRFKLVDFGSVGQLDVATGLTSSGQLAGTPYFMSPEQLTGAPQGPASAHGVPTARFSATAVTQTQPVSCDRAADRGVVRKHQAGPDLAFPRKRRCARSAPRPPGRSRIRSTG